MMQREGRRADELLLLAVRESFYRSADRRRSNTLKQRVALLLLRGRDFRGSEGAMGYSVEKFISNHCWIGDPGGADEMERLGNTFKMSAGEGCWVSNQMCSLSLLI